MGGASVRGRSTEIENAVARQRAALEDPAVEELAFEAGQLIGGEFGAVGAEFGVHGLARFEELFFAHACAGDGEGLLFERGEASSSNTMVITLSPNRLNERNSVMRGMDFMDCSMG